jgi:hypothetical protein
MITTSDDMALVERLRARADRHLARQILAPHGDAPLHLEAASTIERLTQVRGDLSLAQTRAAAWKWAVADLCVDVNEHDLRSLNSRIADCLTLPAIPPETAIPEAEQPKAWRCAVYFEDREDGGVRVWSDDEPGLILSGRDRYAVGAGVLRALDALRAFREGREHPAPRIGNTTLGVP